MGRGEAERGPIQMTEKLNGQTKEKKKDVSCNDPGKETRIGDFAQEEMSM